MSIRIGPKAAQVRVVTVTDLRGNRVDLSGYSSLQLVVEYASRFKTTQLVQQTLQPTQEWQTGRVEVTLDGTTLPFRQILSLTLMYGTTAVFNDTLEVTTVGLLTEPPSGGRTKPSTPDTDTGTDDDQVSTDSSCGDSGNISDFIPGVGIPDFMPPKFISGHYYLTEEDGYRFLIATADTTVHLPIYTANYNLGWYCCLVKRTVGIVRITPESSDIKIYSIEDAREILEVNGMATLAYTEEGGWQLTGGLA